MIVAGHRFLESGDLLLSYHRPDQGVFMVRVWGFRGGQKVLVDSWCEPRCPRCGCPTRAHASTCPFGKE